MWNFSVTGIYFNNYLLLFKECYRKKYVRMKSTDVLVAALVLLICTSGSICLANLESSVL